MKKIYIVTGANGFLGNNIIRKLEQDDNNEIRAFILNGESIKSLEKLKCKIYYGDVAKKETLLPLFENIDGKEVFVIHCAAVVYIKTKYNPLVYNVNVNGTKNVVDKVIETKAKLIYISSVHAIPEKENNDLIEEITDFNPDEVHGLYAKTKAEAAKYVMNAVKNKNLNACIIHPSGIIGPYDYGNSHLTELVREVSNGKLFATVKGGYDFVDVRDVAAAIITASKKDNKGECYILSNKYITIKELSDLICDVQGIKKIKIVLPICLAKIIVPFFEAYYNLKKQTPLFTKYSLYALSSNSNFSNKKAKEELGYKNRDMKDTIKDTISWLNKKEEKKKNKKINFIVVIILILALIPIPMKLKDGGSVEYKAILYEVKKYHTINTESTKGYDDGLKIKILGLTIYDKINTYIETENNDDGSKSYENSKDCCESCICGDTIELLKKIETAWTLTEINSKGEYKYIKDSFINFHGTGKNKFAFFKGDKEVKGEFTINKNNEIILIPNDDKYSKITCKLGKEKDLIAVMDCDNNFGTFTLQKEGTIELPNIIKDTISKTKSIKVKGHQTITEEKQINTIISIINSSKVWTGAVTLPSPKYEIELFDVNNNNIAKILYNPDHYFNIEINKKRYELTNIDKKTLDTILEK